MAKFNKCNNTLSKNNKSGYCKVYYYNRSKSANEADKVNDGNRQSSTQLNLIIVISLSIYKNLGILILMKT